jgi:hypothetical protein
MFHSSHLPICHNVETFSQHLFSNIEMCWDYQQIHDYSLPEDPVNLFGLIIWTSSFCCWFQCLFTLAFVENFDLCLLWSEIINALNFALYENTIENFMWTFYILNKNWQRIAQRTKIAQTFIFLLIQNQSSIQKSYCEM